MAELRVRHNSDFNLLQMWIHRGMLGGHAKKMIGHVEKLLDGRWTFDEIKNYISAYKQLTKAEGGVETKVMERAVQWMIFHPNPDNGDQTTWFKWDREVDRVIEEREANAALASRPPAGRRRRQQGQNEPEAVRVSRARARGGRALVSTNAEPGPSRSTLVGQTTATDQTPTNGPGRATGSHEAAAGASATEQDVAGGPSSSALSSRKRQPTTPVSNAMPSPTLPDRTTSVDTIKVSDIKKEASNDGDLNTSFKNSSNKDLQVGPKDNISTKSPALPSTPGGGTFKVPPLPTNRRIAELTAWKRDPATGAPQVLHRQRSELLLDRDSDNPKIVRATTSRSASPDPPYKTQARPDAEPSSRLQAQTPASHHRTQMEYELNKNPLDSRLASPAIEQRGYPYYPRDVPANSGRGANEPLSRLGNQTAEHPQTEHKWQSTANSTPQQRRVVSDNLESVNRFRQQPQARYAPSPVRSGGYRAQTPADSGRATGANEYGRNNLDGRARRQSENWGGSDCWSGSYRWSGRYDDRHRA